MSRTLFAATMLVSMAVSLVTEAEDYGKVVITPKNPRIGKLPPLKKTSMKAPLEWVQDPDNQSLGLWSPSDHKFILVFAAGKASESQMSSATVDYGTVTIQPRNPRIGKVPQPRGTSTKATPEWVKDPTTESLGLWSPSDRKFLIIFAAPAVPMPPKPEPDSPKPDSASPNEPAPGTSESETPKTPEPATRPQTE